MPNRILKESVCTSDTIDRLTWFEEIVFYRLLVNCDDYGRTDGRIAVIKSRLFPLKSSVTEKAVAEAIHKLSTVGLIMPYEFDGKLILQMVTWDKHQSVRNKRSKYPAIDGSDNTTAGENARLIAESSDLKSIEINCMQMHADVPVIQSNPIQSESNPNTNTIRRKFTPPTIEEIKAYCHERKNSVDPKRFFDYFDASGWVDSTGKPVRNWKQKVITWESGHEKTRDSPGTTEIKPTYGTIL